MVRENNFLNNREFSDIYSSLCTFAISRKKTDIWRGKFCKHAEKVHC